MGGVNGYGKNYWAKGSKYYQVAINQNWKCPVCGERQMNSPQTNNSEYSNLRLTTLRYLLLHP